MAIQVKAQHALLIYAKISEAWLLTTCWERLSILSLCYLFRNDPNRSTGLFVGGRQPTPCSALLKLGVVSIASTSAPGR